jgi:hypothetical protein
MSRAKPNRYARELLKHLPDGYEVMQTNGHSMLLDPAGVAVRRPNGLPIRICNTPGDARALVNDLSKIKRAGVPVR